VRRVRWPWSRNPLPTREGAAGVCLARGLCWWGRALEQLPKQDNRPCDPIEYPPQSAPHCHNSCRLAYGRTHSVTSPHSKSLRSPLPYRAARGGQRRQKHGFLAPGDGRTCGHAIDAGLSDRPGGIPADPAEHRQIPAHGNISRWGAWWQSSSRAAAPHTGALPPIPSSELGTASVCEAAVLLEARHHV